MRYGNIENKTILGLIYFLNKYHDEITLSECIRYMNNVIEMDKEYNFYGNTNNTYYHKNFIDILDNFTDETLEIYKEHLIDFFNKNNDYFILLNKDGKVYQMISFDINNDNK